MDSIITTSMTMHMMRMGVTSKWGMPNCRGMTTPNQGALATSAKLMATLGKAPPATLATTAPAMMPASTATLEMKPLAYLVMPRITSSTNSAMARPSSASRLGLGTTFTAPSTTCTTVSGPSAQPTPMRMRDRPITVMIVPVTTGGKKRSTLPTRGAARKAKRPAAMTEP